MVVVSVPLEVRNGILFPGEALPANEAGYNTLNRRNDFQRRPLLDRTGTVYELSLIHI